MTWETHIERALKWQKTHTIEDVRQMIADGDAQLWEGKRSAAVTEIIKFPRMKTLHLWLCGGDLMELMEMFPAVEAFARVECCDRMTTAGRVGWDRVMKMHGFSPVASVCAKDLL